MNLIKKHILAIFTVANLTATVLDVTGGRLWMAVFNASVAGVCGVLAIDEYRTQRNANRSTS